MSAEPPFVEKRAATPIQSTEEVAPGSMVQVPTAPATGPITAPVVAVNSDHWWENATFVSAAGGAVIALADPVLEALLSDKPFNWKTFAAGCILAVVAYLKKSQNQVVR